MGLGGSGKNNGRDNRSHAPGTRSKQNRLNEGDVVRVRGYGSEIALAIAWAAQLLKVTSQQLQNETSASGGEEGWLADTRP